MNYDAENTFIFCIKHELCHNLCVCVRPENARGSERVGVLGAMEVSKHCSI